MSTFDCSGVQMEVVVKWYSRMLNEQLLAGMTDSMLWETILA